ncbi:MAG: cyclic nucleotide-binding domain-containing protein [Nitrospirae bacterium]|nr:cyclic nucleotide-binding domain-containing protein [Nitrospirota bacterium]
MTRDQFYQGHPVFRKLALEMRTELMELAQDRFFEGKRTILEEGELSGGIYFIRTGRVGVVKRSGAPNSETIAYLSDGELFGEMSFLDGQPAIAGIVATEATHCEFLPEESLKVFLERHASFAFYLIFHIARSLCTRLRETDERLVRFIGLMRDRA